MCCSFSRINSISKTHSCLKHKFIDTDHAIPQAGGFISVYSTGSGTIQNGSAWRSIPICPCVVTAEGQRYSTVFFRGIDCDLDCSLSPATKNEMTYPFLGKGITL